MKILLTSIFFLVVLSSFGQSISVKLSSDSILLGNYFEISFNIENSDAEFEAPVFENMQIIAGPNYSSSIQIINGKSSSKKSISYFLKPLEVGHEFIPPAYLIGDELNLETEAIEINVYPNPEGIIANPKLKNNFSFDAFSWPDSQLNNKKVEKLPKSKSKKKLRKL